MQHAIEKDRQFANTLARGLELMQCFRAGETALRSRDFVERTGLNKATVSRLTYTLAQQGYLRHDRHLRRYRLGSSVLSMGYSLLAGMRARQVARPHMQALADEFNGSVALGIRDRLHMINVETCRRADSLTPRSDIGLPLPLMETAMGRAWLAHASPRERDTILNQLKVNEPRSFQRNHARIAEAQYDMMTRGFCMGRGEWRAEYHGVAVPVSVPVDAEILVFNCGITAAQAANGVLEREVGPRLVTLVRNVERALSLR
ncbi:MAG: IclR family transcriptional regulator [Cupriavidus necator]